MQKVKSNRQSETLLVVRVIAGLYAIGSFAVAAFMLFVLLSSGLGGGGSAITLPVGAGPATQISVLDPAAPDGYFTQVEFTAEDLSFGASLLYYAPRALTPLAQGMVALAVFVLAGSVRRGQPFAGPVIRGIATSAFTIAIVGSANQLLTNFGVSLARWELLSDTPLLGGYVAPPAFDWTPVVIGLALGIVAGVFRAGAKLEHDSAGLV